MDRLIYTAMAGAAQTLQRQASVAHNLANAATGGYRAETSVFRAAPLEGEGAPTRVMVMDSTAGWDFAPGPVQHTGRDFDVAVQGSGWIAVQLEDGSEAYTRNGSLQVSANGVLQTRNGMSVLGDGGPLSIPADVHVSIARDGTISTVPTGNKPNAVATLGRIKLVNPPEAELERGGDGLFRLRGGGAAEADPKVSLAPGALEGSNVNVVEEMVNMIELAREFEMQMKLLGNAEENSRRAGELLVLNR